MMPKRHSRAAWLCVAVILASTARAEAQANLETARGLYAAAAYGDALSMLDRLLNASHTRRERQSIELYRTLCLVAVGRRDDADKAIEQMIAQDPLYRPESEDVPPRLRLAFSDVRRRMLPSIIQARYVEAKMAFDRAEMAVAAEKFQQVIEALADADIADAAGRPPLADLRTLASGFRDLAAKATPPPAPEPVVASAPVALPAPVPVAPAIYSGEEDGVRPPVVLNQSIPPFPGRVTGWISGMIEVIIDETGSVESAAMIVPLSPQYDALALGAARNWQYRPATMNGVPVKFRKRIQVKLSPRS